MTAERYRAVLLRAWERLDDAGYHRAAIMLVRHEHPFALASWLRRFKGGAR